MMSVAKPEKTQLPLLTAILLTLLAIVTACQTLPAAATPTPTPISMSQDVPSATPTPQSDNFAETANTDQGPKAIFAAIESGNINFYSVDADGSNMTLLLTHELGGEVAGPWPSRWNAQLSPDGKFLAYKAPSRGEQANSGWLDLFLLDIEGRKASRIHEKAHYNPVHWFPNSQGFIYPTGWPEQGGGGAPGAPIRDLGMNWNLFNVHTNKSGVVIPHDANHGGYSKFWTWVDDERVLVGSESILGEFLGLLNITTREVKPIKLPKGELWSIIGWISANPSRTRFVIVGSLNPSGLNGSCDFFEISPDWEGVEHIISYKNYRCGNISWNGDDEFFYGTNATVTVTPSTNEISKPVHPRSILSIHRYNFEAKTDERVLEGKEKENYRLWHVSPDGILAVSNESSKQYRSPTDILEFRDMNGEYPVAVFPNNRNILFIGWTQ